MTPDTPDRKFLFVSHEASRTGAPLILLGIIKEYINQTSNPVKIIVMADGPLLPEFQKLGETYVWPTEPIISNIPIYKKIGRAIRKVFRMMKAAYILYKIRDRQIVLLNTITNGHIQKKLHYIGAKFITYVHELEYSIKLLTTPALLQSIKEQTDLFLAGSIAVKNNLVQNHQIEKEKIKVAYSTIEKTLRDKNDFSSYIKLFKEKHNIRNENIVIGAASSGEWRKGFDLFVPLILTYFKLYPNSNVTFIWKGYRGNPNNRFYDTYDLEKKELASKICLLPHDHENIETIACFDIHLLLSREDPYPLVNLEAASLGIPTICFQDTGGSAEFIKDDAGIIVPYGDLITFSHSLNELVINSSHRLILGENAKKRVHSIHHVSKTTTDIIVWSEALFHSTNADNL